MTLPRKRRSAVATVVAATAAALWGGAAVQGGADAALVAGTAGGERVLLTREEALDHLFPEHGPVESDRWDLTAGQRGRVGPDAGGARRGASVEVLRVLDGGGGLRGYAVVLDERGKYRPITFMVGVTPDFRVAGVEVMVYREDRGDEIRHRRFLRQYRGKTSADPIRTHRDIVNITGATISVSSLNRGVRRALATVEMLYGGRG